MIRDFLRFAFKGEPPPAIRKLQDEVNCLKDENKDLRLALTDIGSWFNMSVEIEGANLIAMAVAGEMSEQAIIQRTPNGYWIRYEYDAGWYVYPSYDGLKDGDAIAGPFALRYTAVNHALRSKHD